MVAAGGNERGLRAILLHELEAEHADVEIERARQVGHLQVDMADAGAGGDGWIRLHGEIDSRFAAFRHSLETCPRI